MADPKELVKESVNLLKAEKLGKAKKFAAEEWPDADWDWPFIDQHLGVKFEFPQQFPEVTAADIIKRHSNLLDGGSTLLPMNPLVGDKASGSGTKQNPLKGRMFLDLTVMAQLEYPDWTNCKAAFSMWNVGTVMGAHRKWGQTSSARQGVTKATVRTAGGKNVQLLLAMAEERNKLVQQKVITAERALELLEKQKPPERGAKKGTCC